MQHQLIVKRVNGVHEWAALSAPISSFSLLLVQTHAARWQAAVPEQLTGAHMYLDIAKSGYCFHGYSGGMQWPISWYICGLIWLIYTTDSSLIRSTTNTSCLVKCHSRTIALRVGRACQWTDLSLCGKDNIPKWLFSEPDKCWACMVLNSYGLFTNFW